MIASTFLAGLAIFWGALIVVVWREPSKSFLAFLLAFAAGVMIAVSGLDLLPAAWTVSGLVGVLKGLMGGCLLIVFLQWLLNKVFNVSKGCACTGILVFTGVALHDILEGIAVAVGFQMTETLGMMLAIAIGLHHVPEGIAMAVPLKLSGVSIAKILALAFFTSLMTPLGVGVGSLMVMAEASMIGNFMATAAGAMLYLAFGELLPEALAQKSGAASYGGLALGVVLMGCFLFFY